MGDGFSRMRSEGFPFIIVGVWGWTSCWSCSRRTCRRRVVVASSLISLYWAAHTHCDTILSFKVWKVGEVSHEMLVLALLSHKMGGRFRVLRDRRNTLDACQCKRVVVSWQAQHFVMWPFAHWGGRPLGFHSYSLIQWSYSVRLWNHGRKRWTKHVEFLWSFGLFFHGTVWIKHHHWNKQIREDLLQKYSQFKSKFSCVGHFTKGIRVIRSFPKAYTGHK